MGQGFVDLIYLFRNANKNPYQQHEFGDSQHSPKEMLMVKIGESERGLVIKVAEITLIVIRRVDDVTQYNPVFLI